jgi:hypothetical protein
MATIAGGFLLAASAALPASGAPVQLWLEPNGGFGFEPTAAAVAFGGSLPDSTFFFNSVSGPPRITVTTPSPIPGVSVQNASFSNPSTGTSSWRLTAQDRAYQDLWIVIQGHDPNDPNASDYNENHKIGLWSIRRTGTGRGSDRTIRRVRM